MCEHININKYQTNQKIQKINTLKKNFLIVECLELRSNLLQFDVFIFILIMLKI
jgi:hypothetical protein